MLPAAKLQSEPPGCRMSLANQCLRGSSNIDINNIAEQNSKIAQKTSIDFANWIAENWVFNGGKVGYWDSKETNSKSEPKYLVDSTEELFNIFLKYCNEK